MSATPSAAPSIGASAFGRHPADPGRARRRLGVAGSVLAHVAVLALAVLQARRHNARPAPEPVLLHLSLPRAGQAAPKAAPAAARPLRPRRPRSALVQPPETPPPPAPAAPAEPAVEAAAEAVEETTGDGDPDGEVGAGAPGGIPGGSPNPVFELAEVARPPRLIKQVTPEYPREARAKRIEGVVVVRVVIGQDGRVEAGSPRVMRSVPALDAAALAAIAGWIFSPAIGHSGQPVRVVIEVPFQFGLH